MIHSHSIVVFVLFRFKPDIDPNASTCLNNASIEFFEPSVMKVASSANIVFLISLFTIVIPFIFSSEFTRCDNTSMHKIKRYGERGQPYRTPLSILKNSDICPLL